MLGSWGKHLVTRNDNDNDKKRPFHFTGWLPNFLLFASFIVLISVCSFVLIEAFLDLHLTHLTVEDIMRQIWEHVETHESIQEGKPSPELKAYLERLGAQNKGVLDSNTISFLFQVFSIALISAGVVLLSRSQRNVRLAGRQARRARDLVAVAKTQAQTASNLVEAARDGTERAQALAENAEALIGDANEAAARAARRTKVYDNKITNLGPFFESRFYSFLLAGDMLSAYQMLSLLRATAGGKRKTQFMIAQARELLTDARNKLVEASRGDVGFDQREYDFLLDLATAAKDNLKKYKFNPVARRNVKDLILLLGEIIRLLDTSPFVERYKEQMAALAADSANTS